MVRNNIIANNVNATGQRPIQFTNLKDTTVSGNIVYNWGVEGTYGTLFVQKTLNGYTGLLDNIRFEANELQDLKNATYLMNLYDVPLVIGRGFVSANNRFFRPGGSASTWFRSIDGDAAFEQYKSAVNDTTSTGTATQYPSPDKATLAAYHQMLGKAASHEAFMGEAIRQSKTNWRPEYTAPVVNQWMREQFGR